MLSSLQNNRKAVGLLTGLFFLAGLHFILYSLDGVAKGEDVVVATYAAALLATGGELGLVSVKNGLVRIVCFLLLGPYLFLLALVVPVALQGWSATHVPHQGREVASNYHLYLAAFPFAISLLLFAGFIGVIGLIFAKD